jgi:hypothetical protein
VDLKATVPNTPIQTRRVARTELSIKTTGDAVITR